MRAAPVVRKERGEEEEMGSFRSIGRIWNTRPAAKYRRRWKKDIVNRSRGAHLQSENGVGCPCSADGRISHLGCDQDAEKPRVWQFKQFTCLLQCVSLPIICDKKMEHGHMQMLTLKCAMCEPKTLDESGPHWSIFSE